ncbi:hypothetical protein D041_0492A, partial [Vibrio parahaemolyticus EKP-008]
MALDLFCLAMCTCPV